MQCFSQSPTKTTLNIWVSCLTFHELWQCVSTFVLASFLSPWIVRLSFYLPVTQKSFLVLIQLLWDMCLCRGKRTKLLWNSSILPFHLWALRFYAHESCETLNKSNATVLQLMGVALLLYRLKSHCPWSCWRIGMNINEIFRAHHSFFLSFFLRSNFLESGNCSKLHQVFGD